MKKKELKKEVKCLRKQLDVSRKNVESLLKINGGMNNTVRSLRENNDEYKEIILASVDNVASCIPTKIEYKGTATIVTWGDGSRTKAVCSKGDKYDERIGLSIALSKRIVEFSGMSTLSELEENIVSRSEYKIYENLKNTNRNVRIKAQKEWEAIPKNKRQSIKDKLCNRGA